MKKINLITAVLFILVLTAFTIMQPAKTIIWKINDTHSIGGYTPVILGNPMVNIAATDTAFYFNGSTDGLVLPVIPIEGWQQFTIEVKFKPAGDGPVAPRFIHFEDTALNRGTFELRLTTDHQWYLDAFLKNGTTNKGLTLIDSTKLHPADKWYWAAMTYENKKMCSYVNAQKELEGMLDTPVFNAGKIALGVRLNKVNWYKGLIGEIRFHPRVLKAGELQRME